MGIIEDLNEKKYDTPKGITSEYSLKKYRSVIESDWAKYLDVLFRCGPFAMNQQFIELMKLFNPKKNNSENHWAVETTSIIKELEELKFVSTGYLNNYKYIYLKHPSYSLIIGNTKHKYRPNEKKDFNNETFIDSILRVEYFLKYKTALSYSNMHEQLYKITEMIYDLIIKKNNLYNYDIATIENILLIGKNKNTNLYQNIINYINNTAETQSRLGIIRILWEHLGREYWKVGRLRNTISEKPYYLQLNHLENGEITLHYIPEIIIFDTNKSYDYYQNRNNIFFHMFFKIPGNNTRDIAENYNRKKVLGNKHENILGYKIKIIGFDEKILKKKADIINESYGKKEYSPMLEKCDYVFLNIDKYLKNEKVEGTRLFSQYDKKIEQAILDEISKW